MTTHNDVRDALGHLSTVEINDSDLVDGVQVALHEEEAGEFFKQVRQNDFEAESKRIGENIVAHIEARKGLGEIFG